MEFSAPALSALSDILAQSPERPSTRFSEDSDVLPIQSYEPTEFLKYEDEGLEVADRDPTMSQTYAAPAPQVHPYQSQSPPPVSLRTQQRMNQSAQPSSRSPSYYNNLTAYPPSTSPAQRSLSQALDNIQTPSPGPAPYSQPIPRPHREGRERDALSALHRGGSVVSNGSSRSSGGGAGPGPSKRRQSGLRSSIVSGDVEDQYQWPTTGDDEEAAVPTGTSQSGHSLPRPPSTRPPSSYQESAGRGSGYGFTSSSVGGFTSSSVGDFSSPLTADTSVAHSAISSPEGSTRRLNSRSGAPNGLARSPSNGSLIGGGRKPGLMRTTSATALNAAQRTSSGSNVSLGQRGLSRSNSYSNRSTRYTVHGKSSSTLL